MDQFYHASGKLAYQLDLLFAERRYNYVRMTEKFDPHPFLVDGFYPVGTKLALGLVIGSYEEKDGLGILYSSKVCDCASEQNCAACSNLECPSNTPKKNERA